MDTDNATYQPLDVVRKEIRVIRIQNTNGDLRCHLEPVSLDDFTPEYTAFLQEYRGNQPTVQADIIRSWIERQKQQCRGSRDGLTLDGWRCRAAPPVWKHLSDALHLRTDITDPWFSVGQPILRRVDNTRLEPNLDQGNVQVQPRFNWGDFEALSYEWGSENRCCDILLNGHPFKVTQSLYQALQKARRLPEIRSGMKLWCDALCIDQCNHIEKNHQVAMMKEIYANAFAVIAWLGDESDDSCAAVEAMIQIHYVQARRQRDQAEVVDPEFSNWIFNHPWHSILALFSRAYWSRLWIIQELALNDSLTLFLCGDRQLSRNMVSDTARVGQQLVNYIFQKLCRDTESNAVGVTRLSQSAVYDTFALVSMLTNEIGEQRQLTVLLDLGQKAVCKDPRDKVFGLLGVLPPQLSLAIIPDYQTTKENVFTKFAEILLDAYGLTYLLAWCFHPSESSLASWVPDWTIRFERNHVEWLHRRGDRTASRCRRDTPKPQTRIEAGKLHCTGTIVDRIRNRSKSIEECLPFKETSSIMGTSQNYLQTGPNQYGTFQEVSSALQRTMMLVHPYARWRTLVSAPVGTSNRTTLTGNIYWIDWDILGNGLDHLFDEHYPAFWSNTMQAVTRSPLWIDFDRFRHTNAHFHIFGHSLQDFFVMMRDTPLPALSEDDEYNMNLSVLSLVSRRLVTTKTGYLGLVPENIGEDDVIALLQGCEFPVILRPVSHGDGLLHFQYVGECYVDGLMDSSVLEYSHETDIVLI